MNNDFFTNFNIEDYDDENEINIRKFETQLENLEKIDQRYNDLKKLYHDIKYFKSDVFDDNGQLIIDDYQRLFDDYLLYDLNEDVKRQYLIHGIKKYDHFMPIIENFIERYPEYSGILFSVPFTILKKRNYRDFYRPDRINEFLTIDDFKNKNEFNNKYNDYYSFDNDKNKQLKIKNIQRYIGKLILRYFKTYKFRINMLYLLKNSKKPKSIITFLSKKYQDLDNVIYKLPRKYLYVKPKYHYRENNNLFYIDEPLRILEEEDVEKYKNNKPKYDDINTVVRSIYKLDPENRNRYYGDFMNKTILRYNYFPDLINENKFNEIKFLLKNGADTNEFYDSINEKTLFKVYANVPELIPSHLFGDIKSVAKFFDEKLPEDLNEKISEYLFGKRSNKKLRKRSNKKKLKKRSNKKLKKRSKK